MDRPGGLDAALRRLPKPDLHRHLLGAIRPSTLVDLARRRGSPLLPVAERGRDEGYGVAFATLPGLVSFCVGVFDLVLDPATFERVASEALEDAAAEGVRYLEMRLTPTSHLARGADEEATFAALDAVARCAERDQGLLVRWVLDFPRTLPLAVAERCLAVALRQRGRGVVGIDVAGDEAACGADPAFAGVFRAARRAGLRVTAHAGEAAGAASVRGALDLYGAERLGHGTRSAEDPDLVRRLAREGVPLEIAVTSNVALGIVASVRAHPVPALCAAGVRCLPCTDDPALFGTDLVREYRLLHEEAGLPLSLLGTLAAAGFEAAFAEAAVRDRLASLAAEARLWASAAPGARGRASPSIGE